MEIQWKHTISNFGLLQIIARGKPYSKSTNSICIIPPGSWRTWWAGAIRSAKETIRSAARTMTGASPAWGTPTSPRRAKPSGKRFYSGYSIQPVTGTSGTTRFLMRVGQPKILISSHLVHTDRHSDKRTHYNIPEFWYRPTLAVPLSPYTDGLNQF